MSGSFTMSDPLIGYDIHYDHINKRLVAVIGGESFSINVKVTGTKHAAMSRSEINAKLNGKIAAEHFIRALKKYRNNNGKSFIVYLDA